MSLSISNIIIRREIEPLLLKAREALRAYEKAANVHVSVLDTTGHTIPEKAYCLSEFFCSLCRKYSPSIDRSLADSDTKSAEYPCTQIHIDAISRAQRSGGVYIYTCDMGFTYWVCPLFSGGRQAGALIAGLVLGIGKQESAERIVRMSRGQINQEAAALLLEGIPEKNGESIKALAWLLLTCAAHVSRGTADHSDHGLRSATRHEILKRRAQQQSNLSVRIEVLKNQYDDGSAGPAYPIEKERQLLVSLRRGDNEAARQALDELLALLFIANPDNFKFIQYRAIELVVLISRAALTSGTTGDILLGINNRYLMRIQEARTMEELIDMLYLVVDSMTGEISPFKGVRHALSLRRAEGYIQKNYTRKVSLQEVAHAAGLSAPYFSTVFKEEMGENLSSYLNRLRVDKAAEMLMETGLPLSEIASSCGFEDQSWFSKIFKNYTGMSPGKYRDQNRNHGQSPEEGWIKI
jgi:AraC-like DNA-binding protein/ligand-binding sensor protein